ncbi:hypothetical protein C3733_08485 [Bacillus amyloliquefaciens]|nr:hypothetical protein C3733_08485 [Bacillus amyloliquefaciens]
MVRNEGNRSLRRSSEKERIKMNVTSIHPDQWGLQCSISLYSNRNNITTEKKKKVSRSITKSENV